MNSAQALAQRLVGEGVTINNVTFKGNPLMAGSFNNTGGTNIGIDSGIVLTNGRAKTGRSSSETGVNGNGVDRADLADAHNEWVINGDADLASLIGVPFNQTKDACVLEFDFVPLGDSIKFRYVFSSEEYPEYACSNFNDAFAFFISGTGFPANTNIALIPGTSDAVTINNINGSNCPTPYPQYFINNESNTLFTHNGHTVIFTALAKVQPCETYHLKLVIADVGDSDFDSGVFLEAKSLSSNATQLQNITQTDPSSGNSYLVEGCVPGSLNIKRETPSATPLIINLSYGGTAQNGVDVQLLPPSITIPANQDSFLLNIIPIIDALPEGIETLKIYTLAGCASGLATDSAEIQIRDFDILGVTPDSLFACRNVPVQLQASAGYATYAWDPNPALSNINIPNPVVNLPTGSARFICTATLGTCIAKDSAYIHIKEMELLSKTNVNCRNGTNGQIKLGAGPEWSRPLEFSMDGGTTYQTDSTFNNLAAGNYTIRIRDAAGCIDSIQIPVTQAYPDLVQTNTVTAATCSGGADGSISISASGGNGPYQYSLNGANFIASNVYNVRQGNYNVEVKDNNGCTVNSGNIVVTLNNNLVVEAGNNETICEGTSVKLNAVTNRTSTYAWSPSVSIDNVTISDPTVSPTTQTKYIVTATSGICTGKDSLIIFVDPAPIAVAGDDITICFGASATLNASGAAEYTWTPSTFLSNVNSAQPVSQKPLATISYYLEVKDSKGCTSLKKDTVTVIVTPAVKLFAGNDSLTVSLNQPVQLNVVQVGDQTVTQYNWTPAYGLSSTIIKNPVATLDRDITYYVTGKTPADCEGSDTINIKVYRGPEIYVPTAFTPNGDGRNDVLKAVAVGMKEFRYFKIFDRFGQQVFFTKDFNKGWDGRIKGAMQNTGTYVWIAETVDYRGNIVQRKGATTIVQ